MSALGALSRNIELDTLGGLEVRFRALGSELLGGKGPLAELRRGAVQVVFVELHGVPRRGELSLELSLMVVAFDDEARQPTEEASLAEAAGFLGNEVPQLHLST